MSRSGENRDSVSRACHGHNALARNDDRSSGGAFDNKRDLGKKSMEDGKRKGEIPSSDSSKKYLENSSGPVKTLGAHPLMLDGVNQKEGVESFWDSSDFGIGLRRWAMIFGDHDLGHLVPCSSTVLLKSIALNSCFVRRPSTSGPRRQISG